MSSNAFASSDSDSDAGRPKRRPLPSYLQNPLPEQSSPSSRPLRTENEALEARQNSDDDEDDGGGDDEDDELSRMRKSGGYAAYADKYARDDAKVERERRRAEQEADAGGVAERVREARQGDEEREAHVLDAAEGYSTVEKRADEDDDDFTPGPALPPGLLDRGVQQKATEERRPRRALDPKIVDDSSDDDEDGSSDDDVALGPALPPGSSAAAAGPGGGGGSQAALLGTLPLTHEASLGTKHEAQVCGLSLDAAGSRFVTASSDSTLRLWDFGTMDSGLRSFRSVEPLDSGPIASARFSNSGGKILCAGNLRVARVFDRDARPLVETVPGDMYIVDMARTKGHTGPLNDAQWIPGSRDHMLATIAGDSTLRVWDVAAATAPVSAFDGQLPRAKQVKVVKLRTTRGGKANATALAILAVAEGNSAGSKRGIPRIAVGCDDSTIKIFDPNEYCLRPAAENTKSISTGAYITGLNYGEAAGHSAPLLLARSSDDALRVFDVRRFDAPLAEYCDLPNAAAQTSVSFMGQNEGFFVTGTSANRRGGTECARLAVYDSRTLKLAWESGVEQERGSVIALTWHSRINQLLYGCADGSTHVMYNPEHSRAGVLQCIVKKERRKQQQGMASVAVGEIYTPNALPMFRDASAPSIVGGGARGDTKRKREAARQPPKDDTPNESKMGMTFTKAFMASKMKKTWTNDPREALMKYHDPALDDGKPKPILADKTREEEEEEAMEALMARSKKPRPTATENK